MRKFLILLAFLFSFASYGQESVFIDTSLIPLVQEYVDEAKERGVDVIPQLLKMEYIGFSNEIPYPILGLATKDQKFVYIASFCKIEPIVLKVVVFHELTHAIFNRGHSECSEFDIMKATSPESFRIYEDKEFWEKRLDELFKK